MTGADHVRLRRSSSTHSAVNAEQDILLGNAIRLARCLIEIGFFGKQRGLALASVEDDEQMHR